MKAIVIFFFCSWSLLAQEINQVDANGNRHGLWKGYYKESKRLRYEGNFNHGVETGVFKYYDDTKASTIIATRDFSVGNGMCYTVFFDQKKFKVSEGNLVNKMPEGTWKYYHYQSTNIMSIENYKNGILDGEKIVYYKNGQIAEKTFYKNGLRNGKYYRFGENGNPIEESEYKNGELNGAITYYDKEGKVLIKGTYKNDIKIGMWETYENGKLLKTESAEVFSGKSFTLDNPNELRYIEDKSKK